jgi:hypothetical protein
MMSSFRLPTAIFSCRLIGRIVFERFVWPDAIDASLYAFFVLVWCQFLQ